MKEDPIVVARRQAPPPVAHPTVPAGTTRAELVFLSARDTDGALSFDDEACWHEPDSHGYADAIQLRDLCLSRVAHYKVLLTLLKEGR